MTISPVTPTAEGRSSVIEVISSRRSSGRVSEDVPTRELIETMLEAATWAPNHRLTQPWRYVVLAGDARLELASATVRAQIRREQPSPDEIDRLHEIARTKVLRAPLIIAVGVEPSPDPKVPEIEEVCAGAAAIQNMLLTAHELGLAAVWRTGDACAALEVKQFLHLTASSLVLGFVYVGYPSAPAPSKSRRPASDFTTWLGYPKSSEATNHAASV